MTNVKSQNKYSPQWNKKDKGIPRGGRNHPPSLVHQWWAGYGGQAKERKYTKIKFEPNNYFVLS